MFFILNEPAYWEIRLPLSFKHFRKYVMGKIDAFLRLFEKEKKILAEAFNGHWYLHMTAFNAFQQSLEPIVSPLVVFSTFTKPISAVVDWSNALIGSFSSTSFADREERGFNHGKEEKFSTSTAIWVPWRTFSHFRLGAHSHSSVKLREVVNL